MRRGGCLHFFDYPSIVDDALYYVKYYFVSIAFRIKYLDRCEPCLERMGKAHALQVCK